MKKTVLNKKKKKKKPSSNVGSKLCRGYPYRKKNINPEDIKEVAKEDFHSFIHRSFIHTTSH